MKTPLIKSLFAGAALTVLLSLHAAPPAANDGFHPVLSCREGITLSAPGITDIVVTPSAGNTPWNFSSVPNGTYRTEGCDGNRYGTVVVEGGVVISWIPPI